MTIATLLLTALLASPQVVSIDTKDTDLGDFFRLMANIANMNVVLHPAVQGKVNLMVKEAPWEQVMDLVLKNYGLGKEVEGNTIRIAPLTVFEAESTMTAAIEATRLNALPLQTRIYFLNYANAQNVAAVIAPLLSPRGSVVVDTPRNALIIRDVFAPEP
jgi:type IV pilus assembly protein PilQ